MSLEGIWMTILAPSWLRNVRNDLHTTWHDTGRATATSGICRGGRATESLSELLNESDGDIVGCDVNSVSNTKDHKGSLSRQRKARVRCIKTGTRGFLDFANANTRFANDGSNQDVRDEEA
jgi:hypothetical protein